MSCTRGLCHGMLALFGALALTAMPAFAQQKPNILVIWGDDIGIHNISAYNLGVMGYKTPNIDRLAKEGALFTDFYAQQSCTAGRASFILGQHPFRTGLLTIGMPGSPHGIPDWSPTIADLLKVQGYVTSQFGKNHLGDRDEHLPSNHGFDEFFGNLYHLNAEEEPEHSDYPKDPAFKKQFGPRGVIHSFANGKIEDTGALTKKRMETMDEEVTRSTLDFIEKAHKDGKPFFVWWNTTRMHIWTHLKPESQGKTGIGIYPDGMVEHDGHVGQLLKKLDELGLPKLFTLRGDPFERADHESIDYGRWRIDRAFLFVPAQAYVAQWLQSLRDFPPRQKPASFSLDRVMETLTSGPRGN